MELGFVSISVGGRLYVGVNQLHLNERIRKKECVLFKSSLTISRLMPW